MYELNAAFLSPMVLSALKRMSPWVTREASSHLQVEVTPASYRASLNTCIASSFVKASNYAMLWIYLLLMSSSIYEFKVT